MIYFIYFPEARALLQLGSAFELGKKKERRLELWEEWGMRVKKKGKKKGKVRGKKEEEEE